MRKSGEVMVGWLAELVGEEGKSKAAGAGGRRSLLPRNS